MNQNPSSEAHAKLPTDRKTAWQRLRASVGFRLVAIYLGFLILLAISADFIANKAPFVCEYQGKTIYPMFQPAARDTFYDPKFGKARPMNYRDVDWHVQDIEDAVWAPVPYGSGSLSEELLPPGTHRGYIDQKGKRTKVERRFRHILGTSFHKVDMLAGLIHGTRVSLMVGFLAAGMAGLIGLILGTMAGFWGDRRLRMKKGSFYFGLLGAFIGWFYGFYVRSFAMADAAEQSWWHFVGSWSMSCVIFLGFVWVMRLLGKRVSGSGRLAAEISIPVDATVLRMVEWMQSMPKLLLIVAIAAIFKDRSIWLVMAIIGMTSWPSIAMLVRGQVKQIIEREYIHSARALGLPDYLIIYRHVLPNALPPIMVIFSVVVGGAILAESALSFLQLVEKAPSWGGLIGNAHHHIDAWWIAVFPGLMIFLTVLSFNLLAELGRDALDPKYQEGTE